MKLIFFLQRNQWFVSEANRWSALQSQQDINLALAVLPLECIDEFEINEQPVQQGTATLSQVNEDSVKLSLCANNGALTKEIELALNTERLSSIDWKEPPHDDGWVDSFTRLHLENVRCLSLKVFIPPQAGSDGKNLLIRNDESREEKLVHLPRGEECDILVVDVTEAKNHRLTLRCEAEAANDSLDARSLGFVLLDKAFDV